MASIVKRGNKYAVVYGYKDELGKKHQKWESYDTQAEAKKRKIQVEYERQQGTFVIPTATTVQELLEEYTAVYGVNKWSMSSYSSRIAMMKNYINPLIGDVKLEDVTPRMMDKFYLSLTKVKAKSNKNRKARTQYVTPNMVSKIHQLLRSAFNQAVKWEMMTRNPCLNATLPKFESKKREIWTAETLLHALEVCDDEILSLAINISFACSLRVGELLGLTWDCIDISEEAVANNMAYLQVNKELQRVNKEVLKKLENKDVIMEFPELLRKTTTTLVMKTPKTKTSVRKIFIPKTVAEMLIRRKAQIEEMKQLYGDEYYDYDLVFCHSTGRPIESSAIRGSLNRLIEKHNLPKVVFHSFRHASITYKLKWNGGDMKSVQGDSGHAQLDMIADVYSHIIDEDRKYNAQKFEEQFYNTKGLRVDEGTKVPEPAFGAVVENRPKAAYKYKTITEETEEIKEAEEVSIEEIPIEQKPIVEELPKGESNIELLTKLLTNPETAALLKLLAKNM